MANKTAVCLQSLLRSASKTATQMSINRIAGCSLFRQNFLKIGKNMVSVEKIVANNQRNEEIISSIQHEFGAIKNEIVARKKQQLVRENAELKKRIEQTLSELIRLETKNGKKQIPVPGARSLCTQAAAPPPAPKAVAAEKPPAEQQKPAKDKKPKKEKPAAAAANTTAVPELPIDVGRLDFRVGKIVEVGRHPDADSLYLEKIDCGEAQPRTVVSGLVKFVPLEQMQNRSVVVLCNLKPAKMRGVTSEAMVMCASTPDKVEILSPPEGSVPGDLVHCEGFERNPDAQLNPKKKVFETCAPDLKTNDQLIACFKGAALHVPGKGNVVAQTLKNVNVK